MWQTTPFVDLFSTLKCMSTELHHCRFGLSRRKLTKLIRNIEAHHHLNQLCGNQHEHEPWGQKPDGSWATAEETAYPWPLARAMATQVVLQLQTKGVECHLPSFAEQECTLQAMRAATTVQPRKNLPPFVPEFRQLIHQSDSSPLPPHARKLSAPQRGYVASTPENHITLGVHFSPEEFAQEALRLQHPTEQQSLFSKEARTHVCLSLDKQDHSPSCQRAYRTSQEMDHSCNRALRRGFYSLKKMDALFLKRFKKFVY